MYPCLCGSTTKEKINVLQSYQRSKMKTVVVQDCTNSLLKSNQSPEEFFEDYKKLVSTINDILRPDHLVLVEVQPLKQNVPNTANNERINNFNILNNDMNRLQLATNVSVKCVLFPALFATYKIQMLSTMMISILTINLGYHF